MRYSIDPKDCIFVKGYGFLSFAKSIVKDFGKNVRKKLIGKYSAVTHADKYAMSAAKIAQKLFNSDKKPGATRIAADTFKTV